MTYVIPSGQEDLVQNNIEFLEFWVQAILPGGQDPTGEEAFYDGKIYLDLGIISEDIIPNVRLNTEDGLSTVLNNLQEDDAESQPRSYIPPSPPVPLGQFSNDKRALEDVGLDGAPNPGTPGAENRDEGALFGDFIEAMRAQYGEGTEEFSMIQEDPSNDDYVYYGENKVLDFKLHERFFRMLGHHDGNTPESGGSDNKTAVTLKPDTEGLVSASSIQQTNSYYQYEIDFNPADASQLNIGSSGSYIVDKIPRNPEYKTWYLVRVPLSDFKRKFGDIESFQNISYIRMWMSGYQKPFTMRFATLEFVGSQWRKVTNLSDSPVNPGDFKLSTINIEENANREPFPYRQPDGAIRALNRSAQIQALENEQSLVLSVENLEAGKVQMVKRVYPG
jgi:cell surface protein SprA